MSNVKCQKSKVLVALSGGVDSSVAAFLLKKQGYKVSGAFMKCFNIDGCAIKDAEDARRVAAHLGIPFYTFDFENEYKKQVVTYMIDGYKKGLTPNPDVMCNKTIKFDLFLKEAKKMGFDFIATGHYAKLKKLKANEAISPALPAGRYKLKAARDTNKDQTYFLWTLTQDILKHCLFPIGDYKKPEVRNIARKAGLPTAEKKDSQGICFLGKVTLSGFLKQYIPPKKGEVRDEKGNLLGTHNGAWYYTIGQRHGLDLKHAKTPETKPRYVVAKDIKTNTIVVAEGNKNPALYKKEAMLENVHLISPQHSDILKNVGMSEIKILARVRYRQPLQKATLNWKLEIKNWKLIFAEPQKFVAPGQSAVFYAKNGEMLGGAIIKE